MKGGNDYRKSRQYVFGTAKKELNSPGSCTAINYSSVKTGSYKDLRQNETQQEELGHYVYSFSSLFPLRISSLIRLVTRQ